MLAECWRLLAGNELLTSNVHSLYENFRVIHFVSQIISKWCFDHNLGPSSDCGLETCIGMHLRTVSIYRTLGGKIML